MQTIITYLALVLGAIFMNAQNSVEVSLTKIKNDNGVVRVGLYNDETQFLDETYKALNTEITDGTAVVTFIDIPDGIYAISCYHDEDEDGKLKMFMNMIPSESYGTSNNARGFFGPPKWEDAKFEVKGGELRKLDIRL